MDNEYTFTSADMQRLTALVHVTDDKRVPEQVCNIIERMLVKQGAPRKKPLIKSLKEGSLVKIVSQKYGNQFKIGEIVTLVEYCPEFDEPCSWKAEGKNDYWWLSGDEFELVQEGGGEA